MAEGSKPNAKVGWNRQNEEAQKDRKSNRRSKKKKKKTEFMNLLASSQFGIPIAPTSTRRETQPLVEKGGGDWGSYHARGSVYRNLQICSFCSWRLAFNRSDEHRRQISLIMIRQYSECEQ